MFGQKLVISPLGCLNIFGTNVKARRQTCHDDRVTIDRRFLGEAKIEHTKNERDIYLDLHLQSRV